MEQEMTRAEKKAMSGGRVFITVLFHLAAVGIIIWLALAYAGAI